MAGLALLALATHAQEPLATSAAWAARGWDELRAYEAEPDAARLDAAWRATEAALSGDDPTPHLGLVLRLSQVLLADGRVDGTFELLAHARERYAGHPWLPYVLHRQAASARIVGDWAASRRYLGEAERVVEEAKLGEALLWETRRGYLALANEMGLTDRADALADTVVAGLERAYDGGEKVVGNLVNAYGDRVTAYLGNGRYRAAIRGVRAALAERPQLFAERPGGKAILLFDAALAHEMLGYADPAERVAARAAFEEVLALGGAATPDARVRSRTGLVRMALADGDLAGAASALSELQVEEGLHAELPAHVRANVRAVEARLARLIEVPAEVPAETTAELPAELPAEARAAARARLALAAVEVLRDLADEPVRPGGVGVFRYRAYREPFGELLEQHLARDGEAGVRAALEVVIGCGRVGSLARALGAPAVDLATVRRELIEPGEVLVVYFSMEDGGHVFALDRERLVHERTLAHHQLTADAQRFRALLHVSPRALAESERAHRARELEELGSRLATALLPGAVGELARGAPALTIVGRDHAGEIPFEALPGKERVLGLEQALAYLPSLQVGVHWARRLRAGPPQVEVGLRLVTNARHGARVRELDESLEELRLDPERLRALVEPYGERAEVWTGERATLAALHGAPPARVLTFLTHGVHDPLRELSRGLVLTPGAGQDGVVFAGDVEPGIAAPLVILAACASGRGPVRQGDAEMGTLTGAFLARGSHAVVSTSAEAAVEPTLVLLGALWAELERGVSSAEALRRARVAVHAAGWPDAHDHALVHLQGRR